MEASSPVRSGPLHFKPIDFLDADVAGEQGRLIRSKPKPLSSGPLGACNQKLSAIPRQIANARNLERNRKRSDFASFYRRPCDQAPLLK